MRTFIYRKVQFGYWGRTKLKQTIKIRAKDEFQADIIVSQRLDQHKTLLNGDKVYWQRESEVK